ncbi:MAG TPA: hypothetical protein VHU44_04760, partial [Acidobacteriaceae bacterium]|nr:hypothetical protein [Acidobacteriaceae bacterium]
MTQADAALAADGRGDVEVIDLRIQNGEKAADKSSSSFAGSEGAKRRLAGAPLNRAFRAPHQETRPTLRAKRNSWQVALTCP